MIYRLLIILLFLFGCSPNKESTNKANQILKNEGVKLIVLGTTQDAGSPHIGCTKKCCEGLFENPPQDRKVVSLGLIDYRNKSKYLFEASPDIASQLKVLKSFALFNHKEMPDGIFLTHAHIGHYLGLAYLGKEAISAAEVPVYTMPKLDDFLRTNGPWSQLVNDQNIYLKSIKENDTIQLGEGLKVLALKVPHRDEYSETVGYKIFGPNKTVLFIPDIDKWAKWELDIVEEIKQVDLAFLDATFYDAAEIKGRDISLIPHPFVVESMDLFQDLSKVEKAKVYFIHFNHTNPLLKNGSKAQKKVTANGFNVAQYKQEFAL